MKFLLTLGIMLVAATSAYAQKTKTDFNPNAKPAVVKPKKPVANKNAEPATKGDSLARKAKIEQPLTLMPSSNDGTNVVLPYELPYGGVVELRVYQGDTTGQMVYQDNYIQEPGNNRIRLKAKAFKAGQAYTAILVYKGKRYAQALSF
jgi:hypothetical protein